MHEKERKHKDTWAFSKRYKSKQWQQKQTTTRNVDTKPDKEICPKWPQDIVIYLVPYEKMLGHPIM